MVRPTSSMPASAAGLDLAGNGLETEEDADAQESNQASSLRLVTWVLTSRSTCIMPLAEPLTSTFCVESGPVPKTWLSRTLMCAPLSSQSCLIVVPPLPMSPAAAALGMRMLSFRLPSHETESLPGSHSAASASLSVIHSATALSVSSFSARAARTRQSIRMKFSSASRTLAWTLCSSSVSAAAAKVFASAGGASTFMAQRDWPLGARSGLVCLGSERELPSLGLLAEEVWGTPIAACDQALNQGSLLVSWTSWFISRMAASSACARPRS
mmetsp:Transcript_115326/g.337154  ORF Transcript_115326/g.337154 Transcript_115326/m.337154 type:complete len:270 (+) Transcript_115326:551-1360(+)